jgi:O-antigen ligase
MIPRVFAALFGAFLGLALLKFGTPPIMEKYTTAPEDVYQVILGSPWPIAWGHTLLAGLVLLGVFAFRWRSASPLWILGLPLAWLGWQLVAGSRSVDPTLSAPTIRHFVACVTCFCMGWFALASCDRPGLFWAGLIASLVIVVGVGWEQHFGGLQRTRDYFYQNIYPTMGEIPPDYLKKISSNRIFSTLFYPNSLAGALLLLLPASLGVVWHSSRERFTQPARWLLLAVIAVLSLACLFWSGSKGGWLLMLVLAVLAMLRLPLKSSLKISVVALILTCGIAGFAWKYAGFFQKGATSVAARFDYWRSALTVTKANPMFGTGPGTFSRPYAQIKSPESEMTRLVHNDFLEQASDSGIPGSMFYVLFIVIGLFFAFPRGLPGDWARFGVWLGLLGWFLQGLIDFSLYVPSVAWCAFALLGWLLGTAELPKQDCITGSTTRNPSPNLEHP